LPGPKSHHKLRQVNPNPGQACLCSPHSHEQDCKPPYLVFEHSEVVDHRNPYAVVCAECIVTGCKKVRPALFREAAPVEVLTVDVAASLELATLQQLGAAMSTRVNDFGPEPK
jgi:hypothetical protein